MSAWWLFSFVVVVSVFIMISFLSKAVRLVPVTHMLLEY